MQGQDEVWRQFGGSLAAVSSFGSFQMKINPFNFVESPLMFSTFSESPNKDSFKEGSKLVLFLELNHLNTLSLMLTMHTSMTSTF